MTQSQDPSGYDLITNAGTPTEHVHRGAYEQFSRPVPRKIGQGMNPAEDDSDPTQDVVALIHNALAQAGYAVRGVGGDGASGAVFEISHPAEPNLAVSLAVYPTPR